MEGISTAQENAEKTNLFSSLKMHQHSNVLLYLGKSKRKDSNA